MEYGYHQAVTGVSHEQYLDTPVNHIKWMTAIHGVVRRIENEKNNPEG